MPELVGGRLLSRHHRFLVDVELDGGRVVTAFVPNTGSLLSCVVPGRPVWMTRVDSPRRRYNHTWVLAKPGRSLVCVDTGVPNRVVSEYARAQKIPELEGFCEYIREVPYGQSSRIDLVCRVHRSDMLRRVWVEVKSVTLMRNGIAYFPDAVTLRGRKHLVELASMVEAGDQALQVFFVQRGDCDHFRPADDIDPAYGLALRRAATAGVGIIALQARVTKRAITIKRRIPVEL